MPVYDFPDDLSKKNRRKDGNKIEYEKDEDADTDFVDPFTAEIPLIPVGRFNETFKATE